VDANGIGFGNVSVRNGTTNNFYITGSATAGLAELNPADCAKVVSYNFERNWLQYEGSAIPSSESLTHAAVYQSDANAGAVIHCHDLKLWRALIEEAPATSAAVEYGTSAMAREVMSLLEKTDVRSRRIVVMAGHAGGLIAFGKDLEQAFTVILREWKSVSSRRQ
jgi:ribulose-5-phosphate 4-epimerase/fuculose-1-phosphate aldolase